MHRRASRIPTRADSHLLALLAGMGEALVVLLYGADDVDATEAGVLCGYR
jgi:hypothetical protein